MRYPIADLHCDLLCYLAHDKKRTPFDSAVRCSIPQLQRGGVVYQAFAIYTSEGVEAVKEGFKQVLCYQQLLEKHSEYFTKDPSEEGKIFAALSIENASSFFGDKENLFEGFQRIEEVEQFYSKILYLSLTWNQENRFGGGAHTDKGLSRDGQLLLEFLEEKNIAVDLSHASDALAFDILNEIDKRAWKLPVIASHSNARAIVDAKRNLPDELIQEIINRKGLIGLNFVRHFLGKDLFSHLEHLLELGGENSVAFGADFFYGLDVPKSFQKPPEELFSKGYDQADVYPQIIHECIQEKGVSPSLIEQLSSKNVANFLERNSLKGVTCGSVK